jgi:hypothetical protein
MTPDKSVFAKAIRPKSAFRKISRAEGLPSAGKKKPGCGFTNACPQRLTTMPAISRRASKPGTAKHFGELRANLFLEGKEGCAQRIGAAAYSLCLGRSSRIVARKVQSQNSGGVWANGLWSLANKAIFRTSVQSPSPSNQRPPEMLRL